MNLYTEMTTHTVSEHSMKFIISELVGVSHEEKSTRIALIDEILEHKDFNPNECMALMLDVIKTEHDIGLCALCLKHGADPNIYLNAHRVGPAHFLIAAFKKLPRGIYANFYCFMVLRGSNPENPCFDPREFSDSIIPESVHSWLKNNGVELPNSTSRILELLPRFPYRDQLCLSVLLDTKDESLKKSHSDPLNIQWNNQALEFMLISRNSNWKNVKYETKDSVYLKLAFKSTFPQLFEHIINDDIRPTYYDFCYFISHMAAIYKIENSHPLRRMCREMIQMCVDRGVEMDLYQLDEIRSIDSEFCVQLTERYRKPLWTKVCSIRSDTYIPSEMSEAFLFFGMSDEMQKYDICGAFEEITSADLETLIKTFKKKNSRQMGSRINMLTDFINLTPESYCDNPHSITGDPMEYSDKALAYYKDSDGKNWCFLSNSFESLLSKKKNPISMKPLPREFLLTLEYQKRYLEDFGISLHEPKTIRAVIENIKKVNEISNDKTNQIIGKITKLLEVHNMSEMRIKNMRIGELSRRLSTVGVYLSDFIDINEQNESVLVKDFDGLLSSKMIFIIICKLVHDKMLEDITKLETFVR